jgi:NTP pyrophosphatase (non-canonical NTP hydrolase)
VCDDSSVPSAEPFASFADLVARASRFRDERDWAQFHSARSLAAAIAIEAAELQEIFLWVRDEDEEDVIREARARIEEELADVLIHCANFALVTGIDVSTALEAKFRSNEAKYPADKARGTATKYTDL